MTEGNLVQEAVGELGGLRFEDLAGAVAAAMPAHFLRSTLDLQPALEPHRGELSELVSRLAAAGGGWHRDPEVFGAITLLSQRTGAGVAPRISALRMHLGLAEPGAEALEDGPYRLTHRGGGCFVATGGRLERLPDDVVATVPGLPGRVLRPWPGLFRDLVGPDLYPRDPAARGEDRGTAVLRQAVDVLERSAPALLADLREVVRTVVLTPDLHDAKRWSYNLRLAYFGAVFVNPFAVGVAGMVESLVHEYVHQRLWQWWAYEPPSGLPPATALVRSPVTGRDKPAPVMVHALLIYVAVHRLLLAVLAADGLLSPAETAAAEEREAALRGAIPRLHEALASRIPAGSATARLVELAISRFPRREVEA